MGSVSNTHTFTLIRLDERKHLPIVSASSENLRSATTSDFPTQNSSTKAKPWALCKI